MITRGLVEKVVLDTSNHEVVVAKGVQYTKDGAKHKVDVRREVILTAGAFNSARLLEFSGIGGPERLREHNIPMAIDNPHVGENLPNHAMCGLSFEVANGVETMDPLVRQEPSALAAAIEAYKQKVGPLASSGTSTSAQLPTPGLATVEGKESLERLVSSSAMNNPPSLSSNAAFAKAHSAFVHSVLTSSTEGSGCYISFPGFAGFAPDGTKASAPAGSNGYFTVNVLLCHPLSRGSTHITSPRADGSITLDPRYLSHPLDLVILALHMRYIDTAIARAEPLRSLLKLGGPPQPWCPGQPG